MKKGWKYMKLGEIATDMYRGSGIRRDQITTNGSPCVRYGEIYTTYNYYFDKCVSHTDESTIATKKYFEYGDILFAITGESVEEIGKSIAYLGNKKCLAGGDIIVMKHNQNPKYLAYALSSPNAIAQKGFGKTKLKVVHTNAPSLKNVSIPVPPLPKQQRIVSYLDAEFAKIDQLKANAEKQLQAAKDLFQSALKELLTPKDGWVEKKLGDISLYYNGLTYKPSDVSKQGFLVLRSSNIQNNKLSLEDQVRVSVVVNDKLKIHKGDIIMCSRNGSKALIGKVAIIPEEYDDLTFGTFMMVIKSKFNPFLYYFFLSERFKGQIWKGEANMINQITRYMLDDIFVCLPTNIDEQNRIVARLDTLSAKVRALQSNYNETITLCNDLKQSLLKDIFE